ncbi:membrane-spanning 4-domains subfamily A member 4A-like isoform X1 [Alligator sinensis]|uniref:Membrane-spanning 4-domains subfamily A member 4A-like isoform X1 n=1 Tax=Alligator sinensis TaxID=38654 RepID=A0A1U8DC35_ALLSI|nr:membrane-spanning 4-domains subfamily A member 4A-like isoform X1 [Alligator sinensis]XP_025068441.1 membrane-spanning 4-domains subfamily A member 4A-like isoform X1 [Alligator sinensis]
MEQGAPGTVLLTQIVPPAQAPGTRPKPLEKFQRGEPLALGITQILVGIQQTVFCIIMIPVIDYHYPAVQVGTPIWTSFLCVISGSLSVAASRKPKISLVKAVLALNSMSAVLSGVGLVVFLLTFIFLNGAHHCTWDSEQMECVSAPPEVQGILEGVFMLLFILTLLQFCLALTGAAFGCKAICRDSYVDMAVVIYQHTEPSTNPTSAQTPGTV